MSLLKFWKSAARDDILVKDVNWCLQTLGDILYSRGLVGDRFSIFSGRYQLPIKPLDDCLVVGPWLKVQIDTSIMPRGVFIQDLQDERLLTTLKTALGRNVEFRTSAPTNLLSSWFESSTTEISVSAEVEFWFFIELDTSTFRGISRLVPYSELPNPNELECATIPIMFGSSMTNFEWFDLSMVVSMLVCGATRTGKSVYLRGLLTWLARLPTSRFQAYLCDFKFGVEFQSFNQFPHYTILSSPDVVLSTVRREMTDRFENYIKPQNCFSILDYNDKVSFDDRLPYKLIVIDEFAAFRHLGGKSTIKDAELLAAQSAGAGLYWLIATQRPSVDIVTGALKANLGARVSFSLATPTDVEVVFGTVLQDCIQIGCPGRAFALVGDRVFEFQAPFIA